MKDTIIYEQPLNELIRVCLRLEQLFAQIDHQLTDNSPNNSRNIISLIINVLSVLERPDIKAKLAKELSSLLTSLNRPHPSLELDTETLNKITQQIEALSHDFINNNSKIGQRVRDMDMINALRLHLANPGGGCNFDLPLYHYWLQQSVKERQAVIQNWLGEFASIRSAVELILFLIRKNTKTEEKSAIHGFYQELLDPHSNLRMIRIAIDKNTHAFPEISLSRHFLSVRYFAPNLEKRPVQYGDNLSFWLGYCYI